MYETEQQIFVWGHNIKYSVKNDSRAVKQSFVTNDEEITKSQPWEVEKSQVVDYFITFFPPNACAQIQNESW